MLLLVFINFFFSIYFFFIKIIVISYLFLIFFNLIRIYFFKLASFLTIIVLVRKLNEVFKLKRILLFILLFFYLLPFSWIYYFLLILNNISYLFLVLLSLNKNIIIKPNKLYWNEMPYVHGSYSFKTIFYEIFKLTLLKINEISYSIYYNFIPPRKSFEIKNFEYLAFRYVFPFSINYLDFILNICLNRRLEEEFTKKVW
jgi:hypothetical protein